MVAGDTSGDVFIGGCYLLMKMPSNINVTAALLLGEGSPYHPFSDNEYEIPSH